MGKYKTAIVIGAGAFGTSMASVLSRNFDRVLLKVRSKDNYDNLLQGENKIYLPGIKLPKNLIPALTWDELESHINENVEIIVSGLPVSGIKQLCIDNHETLKKYFEQGVPFVSLSKGIAAETLELPDDIFLDYFAEYRDLFTFLSGPSFAKEILQQQVTLVALAGRSRAVLKKVSLMMQTDYFRCALSYDVKGVLLGGALKNILAIAGGIVEGLGYNHNTRAALITRGIGEMLEFGKIYNARVESFYGLSGVGDLILTTTGELSRNKQFGLELAKGRKAQEIIDSQRSVVEGHRTAKAVHYLAERYELQAQIFDGLYRVLYEDAEPQKIIIKLMRTPGVLEDF